MKDRGGFACRRKIYIYSSTSKAGRTEINGGGDIVKVKRSPEGTQV